MKKRRIPMLKMQLLALLAIGMVPVLYAQQHPGCVSARSCYYSFRVNPAGGYCGGSSPFGVGVDESNDDYNEWWNGTGNCGTKHDIFGNDSGEACGPTPVTQCS